MVLPSRGRFPVNPCPAPYPSTGLSKLLITRPLAFDYLTDYENFMNSLISPSLKRSLRIIRIDCAVDYSKPLQTVIQSLDVLFKRVNIEHHNTGGRRTGLRIGTRSEKIIVYDKALERRQKQVLTRIEMQQTGSRLLTRSYLDLVDILKTAPEKLAEWAFGSVRLYNIAANPLLALSDAESARLAVVQRKIESGGFFQTKRELNDSGNFARDYQRLLEISEWPE